MGTAGEQKYYKNNMKVLLPDYKGCIKQFGSPISWNLFCSSHTKACKSGNFQALIITQTFT